MEGLIEDLDDDQKVDDINRIGDHICLFCAKTSGFVYSDQSNSLDNGVFALHSQDINCPYNIPSQQALEFCIHVQNRYRLNKRYRQLLERAKDGADDPAFKSQLEEIKLCSEAEDRDNRNEQKRMHGKPLKYGDIIQLKHIFSKKNIHVNLKKTSKHDKGKFAVFLSQQDGKSAQFRILPKYKVNAEGEFVRAEDQVVFESIQSPGRFLHASPALKTHYNLIRSEINLSVSAHAFTIIKNCSWDKSFEVSKDIMGGAIVYMHHKDMEAYLCCEGIFGNPSEKVHMWISSNNSMLPRTLYAPYSCRAYWQIEKEACTIDGSALRWGERIRIRHFTTRSYLALDSNGQIYLTNDHVSQDNIFKLCPMHKFQLNFISTVDDCSFARIQHVISGRWLHGMNDADYERNVPSPCVVNDELKKLGSSEEKIYHDAFSLQRIHSELIDDANFVMGILPVIRDATYMIIDHKDKLRPAEMAPVTNGLEELTEALSTPLLDADRRQHRKELMRDLKLIELSVGMLQALEDSESSSSKLYAFQQSVYGFLLACIKDDLNNCLYMAQYLDFFQARLSARTAGGLFITGIMVELITDKRQVLDRFSTVQIERCVNLMKKYENYQYLRLLSALCVCKGVAIPQHQSFIADRVLSDKKGHLYRFKIIDNTVYMYKKKTDQDMPMSRFLETMKEDDKRFLEEQLRLYGNLCKGRNAHCVEQMTLTNNCVSWDVAFSILNSTDLSPHVKSMFCLLIIDLFVDIDENTPLLECMGNCYLYEDLKPKMRGDDWLTKQVQYVDRSLDARMPEMQRWLINFFNNQIYEIANEPEGNKLVLAAVRLTHFLIKYGYFSAGHMFAILPKIISLLDVREDFRFGAAYRRFKQETTIVANARSPVALPDTSGVDNQVVRIKYELLLVLEQYLGLQFQFRLEMLIALYKTVESKQNLSLRKRHKLDCLLYGTTHRGLSCCTLVLASPKERLRKCMEVLFKKSALFHEQALLPILLSLGGYDYDILTTKSIEILVNHFNVYPRLYETACMSQIIVSAGAKDVLREVQIMMPLVKRLLNVKIYDDQAYIIMSIIEKLKGVCQGIKDAPPKTITSLLINQGFVTEMFHILEIESRGKNGMSPIVHEALVEKALESLGQILIRNEPVAKMLFSKLNILLSITTGIQALSLMLKQMFIFNAELCDNLDSKHVKDWAKLVIQWHVKAPGLLEFPHILSKGDGQRNHSRNQYLFSTQLLDICYKDKKRVCFLTSEDRIKILLTNTPQRDYLIGLIKYVALCTQETGSIFSFSQDLLNLSEIGEVLNHKEVSLPIKHVYLSFMMAAHIQKASNASMKNIVHQGPLWSFFKWVASELDTCIGYMEKHQPPPLPTLEEPFKLDNQPEPRGYASQMSQFMIEAFFPFIQKFNEDFDIDDDNFPDECKIYIKLSAKIACFIPLVGLALTRSSEVQTVLDTLKTIKDKMQWGRGVVNDILESLKERLNHRQKISSDPTKQPPADALREIKLNELLQDFIANCVALQDIPNTVESQIGYKGFKVYKNVYTEKGTAEELPLNAEFQHVVKSFVHPHLAPVNMKYHHTKILIKQLQIAADKRDLDGQYDLELMCLKILRAQLHNNIVILPDITAMKREKGKYQRHLQRIKDLQGWYTSLDLIPIVIKLMACQSMDIFKECMAMIDALLYNANSTVQDCILTCFKNTREEVFFMMIKDYLNASVNLTKEKRLLERHHKIEKEKETNCTPLIYEKKAEKPKLGLGRTLLMRFKQKQTTPEEDDPRQSIQDIMKSMKNKEGVIKTTDYVWQHAEHDAIVKLILKVAAMLCDGQHRGLQDYLREQPDNLRTFNLVSSVTAYIGTLYTVIREDTISLTTQVFETLLEICSGNQENRQVVLDNKLIDYVNCILRMKSFGNCPLGNVVSLLHSIVDLIIALVEENGDAASRSSADIAETLDSSALLSAMEWCYELQYYRWWGSTKNPELMKQLNDSSKAKKKEMSETVKKVGSKFCMVFARLRDIKPNLEKTLDRNTLVSSSRALEYYQQQIGSVEVIKDGFLNRIYYPVDKNMEVRQEVKEKLKWNVDRTSGTNKIRDFMEWSKYIIDDIHYHRKVTRNPIARLIVNKWMLWNYITIILSLTINVFMLATWHADGSMKDYVAGSPTLPPGINGWMPETTIDWEVQKWAILGLSLAHNLFTLIMVISYFLAEHPRLPKIEACRDFFAKTCGVGRPVLETNKSNSAAEAELAPRFLSLRTFYYINYLIFSIAGTLTYGYFFAFHMLNIVTTNELLKGVIRAVTLNGKSLLWVAILGVFMLYIYGLIAFAFFRPTFNPENYLYCDTLAECTVTVVRYGLTGLIDEVIVPNPLENSFAEFGFLTIYQLSFFIFITTIGLNIIFGIIVDTFSELRDRKWRAEKDMRDNCFICGLPCYEFEHQAKGFVHHTKFEHSMWSYIHYFIYLSNTSPNDYTALDFYVASKKKVDNYDFFPQNRALSISKSSHDNETNKLDVVSKQVQYLIDVHKKEVLKQKMKLEEERIQKSRLTLTSVPVTRATTAETRLPELPEPPKEENVPKEK